jgi:hypothetical protein
MPKIPGVNHLRAVQAFEKAGFDRSPRQTHCHERRFAFHHHTASRPGERPDDGWDSEGRRNVGRRISQSVVAGSDEKSEARIMKAESAFA